MKLQSNNKSISNVTKNVIKDFNSMNNDQFFKKYSCSKKRYKHRVEKYGDPYMHSILTKIGKRFGK